MIKSSLPSTPVGLVVHAQTTTDRLIIVPGRIPPPPAARRGSVDRVSGNGSRARARREPPTFAASQARSATSRSMHTVQAGGEFRVVPPRASPSSTSPHWSLGTPRIVGTASAAASCYVSFHCLSDSDAPFIAASISIASPFKVLQAVLSVQTTLRRACTEYLL